MLTVKNPKICNAEARIPVAQGEAVEENFGRRNAKFVNGCDLGVWYVYHMYSLLTPSPKIKKHEPEQLSSRDITPPSQSLLDGLFYPSRW